MPQESRIVTLDTLNGGAVIELFTEEFEKLLKNVADDNTEPDKIRQISIKVSVKPSKNREMASTKVEVTSKLAPLKPHEATVFLSFDGKKVEAYTTANAHQPELPIESGNTIEFRTAAGEK